MKLLLTSGGFTNKSIANALLELAGKPFKELKFAFVPTAANADMGDKSWLVNDLANIRKLGLKNLDIVDISALPKKIWLLRLEAADVLFFSGGVTPHLMYWLKRSGLAKILPKLLKTRVYGGISAGSMVAGPSIALSNRDKSLYYEKWSGYKDEGGLSLVDFYVRPHLNTRFFPKAISSNFAKIAKEIKEPIYALDDNSAIKVDGDKVTVISEGKWEKFN